MNTPENTTDPVPPPPPADERFLHRAIDGPCHPFAVVETLLKQPGRILFELRGNRAATVCAGLCLVGAVCLAIYGIVAGSLTGGEQLLFAPVKILLGSILCAVICLPSLFIFLCLGGADVKLRSVAGELLASVALTSLLLLGFAPVAWVFSQSTDSVALIAVLHLIFWAIALCFGLRIIGRRSAGRSSRIWIAIYVVVCLQMMTALRPILGRSTTVFPSEKKFFLTHMMETLTKPSKPVQGR